LIDSLTQIGHILQLLVPATGAVTVTLTAITIPQLHYTNDA